MLESFNYDLSENVQLKSDRSMYVENFFRVDLNYLGLPDIVLMCEGRLLKTLIPE